MTVAQAAPAIPHRGISNTFKVTLALSRRWWSPTGDDRGLSRWLQRARIQVQKTKSDRLPGFAAMRRPAECRAEQQGDNPARRQERSAAEHDAERR